MTTSVFEQVASSLTVKLICQPVLGPNVRAGSMFGDLMGDLYRRSFGSGEVTSRVIDPHGKVLGLLSWGFVEHNEKEGPFYSAFTDMIKEDDEPVYDETSVDPYVQEPRLEEIVSSGTTILDALDLFAKRPNNHFYYILRDNDLFGVLYYSDMSKPAARLAYLALVLEIETLALDLCQADAQNCWNSLGETRQKKALEILELRHPGHKLDTREVVVARELIECTQYIDKGRMLWKARLIEANSRAEVLYRVPKSVTLGPFPNVGKSNSR